MKKFKRKIKPIQKSNANSKKELKNEIKIQQVSLATDKILKQREENLWKILK